MPLARSVSSPAMMDVHATPRASPAATAASATGAAAADHATPSQALYRSASVARALATTPLLYSATRGSRHRLRRKLASLGDGEGEGGAGGSSSSHSHSQSFTPSIRRTMSVHGSPVFGPSIPTLTPSTISKRARAPAAGSKLGGGGGLSSQGAGSLRRPLGSSASAAAAQKRAMQKRRRIRVKLRVPRSALPPEIIFVDNEAYNVAEVQTGLKIAKKLKIPLRCYCFAPTTPLEIEELQQQQQAAAAAAENEERKGVETAQIAADDVEADGDEEPSPADEVAAAAGGAGTGVATEPLQSPTTASIATALSLANLGSPVALHHARTHQWPQQQGPATPAGGAGIYGFMLALGNVLPSTVGVVSPHAASSAAAATAAAEAEYPHMAAAADFTAAADSSAAAAFVPPSPTAASAAASGSGASNRRDSTSSMGSAASGSSSALNSPMGRMPGVAAGGGNGGPGSVPGAVAESGEEFAGYERDPEEGEEGDEEEEEEVSEADPEEDEEVPSEMGRT